MRRIGSPELPFDELRMVPCTFARPDLRLWIAARAPPVAAVLATVFILFFSFRFSSSQRVCDPRRLLLQRFALDGETRHLDPTLQRGVRFRNREELLARGAEALFRRSFD